MKFSEKDYKSIFLGIESTLLSVGSKNLPEKTIREYLDQFKQLEGRTYSDIEYYWKLVLVTFYAGFRASTVTTKLGVINKYFNNYKLVANYGDAQIATILDDRAMIRNQRKVRACIDNARTILSIVENYGSIQEYIDSFAPTKSFENLLLLKEELEYRFVGLGSITTYHFLTDIGMPVLKPDRAISRIFKRLGLIESEQQKLKTVIQGRRFAQATGHPIRYIDIVFVTYGQLTSEDFGITRGICLEKQPDCEICGVKNYCYYYIQKDTN
jgi:DNA-3-methyladenine glycosylase I